MALKRWTINELTRYLRQMFETDYRLQDLEVEGEVSNWSVPASGHAYFTLKDAEAQLKCVMWRSDLANQQTIPRNGDRVLARGHLSVYDAGGQYQLYCRLIQPAGLGDLYAQFEELKNRLQAEGLFSPERKRPLPEQISVIGVVTSPSTAALQDVLNILRRRNPLAQVILSPAPVQGDQAPPRLVEAIEAINTLADVDVLLVVRGGGSLEDLWCFNDERVARAVAASRIPVVSGVGHEIDFTLTDFAADLRAPTPSAAAELATPLTVDDRRALLDRIQREMAISVQTSLDNFRQHADHLDLRLQQASPTMRLVNTRQQVGVLIGRAYRAASADFRLLREQLAGQGKALTTLNPHSTLERGYAIVRRASGEVVRRASEAPAGSTIEVTLHQGKLSAAVESATESQ
jgi:exodeoxyribonuclease VII large subunit